MTTIKPAAKPAFGMAKSTPSAEKSHTSSASFAKQTTSQRIASDIDEFRKAGGHIEVLGITRVEYKKKEERPRPAKPAAPKKA